MSRIARGSTSTQTIKERIKEKHGSRQIQILSIFESWSKKMKFKCYKCKHEWEAKPQAVCDQTGCPECAWTKRRIGNAKATRKLAEKHKLVKWEKQYYKYIKLFPNLKADKNNNPVSMKSVCKFTCTVCDSDYKWTFNRIQNKLSLLETNKSKNPHYCGCPKCMRAFAYKKDKPVKPKVIDYSKKKCKGYSRIAIYWLEEMSKLYKTDIQHVKNKGEFIIPNTKIKVDGYSKKLNTVFEFYGDAYHGNPDLYESDIITTSYSDKTAEQLYQETLLREKKIKALGYNVVSVWERDYINSLIKRGITKTRHSFYKYLDNKNQVGFSP